MLRKAANLTAILLSSMTLTNCGADSGATSSTQSGTTTSPSTEVVPGSSTAGSTAPAGTGGAGNTTKATTTRPAQSTGGTTSLATATSASGGKPAVATTIAAGGTTAVKTTAGTAPSTGGGSGTGSCQKFSFFVTSMAAMIELSGSENGFGGDLRYPKGSGDGLSGADAICTAVAAKSLPCAKDKVWHAFLSTATVDAIDRIGTGPWYDRKQRLVWNNTTEMASDRPPNAPAAIRDDLPNEDGVPNHDYDLDGSTTDDDNHDVLTGSGPDGRKIASDTPAHRCNEWTSTTATPSSSTTTPGGGFGGMFPGGGSGPMCGHSWPRMGSGTNWASSIREGGCGAGINLKDNGGATSATVGSGGGYGGIYCFAMTE